MSIGESNYKYTKAGLGLDHLAIRYSVVEHHSPRSLDDIHLLPGSKSDLNPFSPNRLYGGDLTSRSREKQKGALRLPLAHGAVRWNNNPFPGRTGGLEWLEGGG